MTLRLILSRHAKSSWRDVVMDDHARPLNKRGRKSAKAIGAWLASQGCAPDQALVSSAERTRETWALLAKKLPAPPEPQWRDDLYHGEPEALLAALRGATGTRVLMLAHNPGIAFFARALLAKQPNDVRFERYPTAATALIDFDLDDWSRVTWHDGRLADFIVPRDLIGA